MLNEEVHMYHAILYICTQYNLHIYNDISTGLCETDSKYGLQAEIYLESNFHWFSSISNTKKMKIPACFLYFNQVDYVA